MRDLPIYWVAEREKIGIMSINVFLVLDPNEYTSVVIGWRCNEFLFWIHIAGKFIKHLFANIIFSSLFRIYKYNLVNVNSLSESTFISYDHFSIISTPITL